MLDMAKSKKPKLIVATLCGLAAVATVFAISHSRPAPRVSISTPIVVSVPTTGKIATMTVKNGDRVQKGEVIAFTDVSGYETQLKEAELALANVQSGSSGAITPIEPIQGIAGFLPTRLPKAEAPMVQPKPIVAAKSTPPVVA